MGVSCQLWNIRDKIREVDDFIAPDRQATIGEAHPELIFRKFGHRFAWKTRNRRLAVINASGSWPTGVLSNFQDG
jgi:predicted RNase H-like nuclease